MIRERNRRAAAALTVCLLSLILVAPTVSARRLPDASPRDAALEKAGDLTIRLVPCIRVSPGDGATGVPVNTLIIIWFCRAVDPSSTVVTSVPAIAFTATWSSGDTVLTLVSMQPLAACTVYTLSVSAGGVGSYTWSFTTACP